MSTPATRVFVVRVSPRTGIASAVADERLEESRKNATATRACAPRAHEFSEVGDHRAEHDHRRPGIDPRERRRLREREAHQVGDRGEDDEDRAVTEDGGGERGRRG
jgi:hypothetical protein